MDGCLRLRDFDRAVWTKLGLARLFDWKPRDNNSLYEGYARNDVISFTNIKVSQAAFAGQLKFEGIKDAGFLHEARHQVPTGPLEPIPANYFRKNRSIMSDGSFAAHEANDEMKYYAASRNGGEAHPNWFEVVVDASVVVAFLESLPSYISQVIKEYGTLAPQNERLSPCEAITFVAFGFAQPASSSGGISKGDDDDCKIFIAEQLLLEAAQLGHIMVYGKPKGGDETRMPADLFRKNVRLSTLDDDLLMVELDDILSEVNWRDLSIDGESFREWIRQALRFDPPKKYDNMNSSSRVFASQRELSLWFDEYKNQGGDLTRDKIESAGKTKFGSRVTTTALRGLYNTVAPIGGNTRGRKPSAANSAK